MKCSILIKTFGNFPRKTDLPTSWNSQQTWEQKGRLHLFFNEHILMPASLTTGTHVEMSIYSFWLALCI